MTTTATAMVQIGARELREQTIELPELSQGTAILRMEACGLCGTDIDTFDGHDVAVERAAARGDATTAFPRIIGHEIVGTVIATGSGGRADAGIGDRVVVDPYIPCGRCDFCLQGKPMHCNGHPNGVQCYGFIPLSTKPGLWGGYASHVYIHRDAVLHAVPPKLSATAAALWNPLAAGLQWSVLTPETSIGSTVVILGCGQRGLTSILAVKAAGAAKVIVTGLSKDAAKLELAREFGADLAIDVEQDDVVARVMHETDNVGADVVVDTSSFSTRPVLDAIALVRPAGRVVLAGLKAKPLDGFPVDDVIHKSLRIDAALGVTPRAHRQALRMLAKGDLPIERMRTHEFDFRDAGAAVDTLAGRVAGEAAISVVLSNE